MVVVLHPWGGGVVVVVLSVDIIDISTWRMEMANQSILSSSCIVPVGWVIRSVGAASFNLKERKQHTHTFRTMNESKQH